MLVMVSNPLMKSLRAELGGRLASTRYPDALPQSARVCGVGGGAVWRSERDSLQQEKLLESPMRAYISAPGRIGAWRYWWQWTVVMPFACQ